MLSIFQRGLRCQRVVVAAVYEQRWRKFLVVMNPRWRGYSFPLRRQRRIDSRDPLRQCAQAVHEARQAVLGDLGPDLGRAADARWMDRIEVRAVSERTGEPTRYVYDIVSVTPARHLPGGVFGGPYGLLSADEIRASDPDEHSPNRRLVTWTTWQVLTKLLDNQQVAVAVVARETAGGREYLLTRNRDGLWFFPSTRMGDQVPAQRLVVYEFKDKADYRGKVEVGERGAEVELEQNTGHLGPRRYTFHLRQLSFPQEDLTLPGNRLEAALDKANIEFRWRAEADLAVLDWEVSNTVAGLREAVLRLV